VAEEDHLVLPRDRLLRVNVRTRFDLGLGQRGRDAPVFPAHRAKRNQREQHLAFRQSPPAVRHHESNGVADIVDIAVRHRPDIAIESPNCEPMKLLDVPELDVLAS
jgi:hypothetical protein